MFDLNSPEPSTSNCFQLDVPPSTAASLKLPTFDSWSCSDEMRLRLLAFMFEDLDIVASCQMELGQLHAFLLLVRANYAHNPFHNFHHCFCVAQLVIDVCSLNHVH